MQSSQGTFETVDGLRLFEQCWRPNGNYKAVVVIVHGYAEYSDCYTHAAVYLIRHSYAVYTFDLRGHGRSEGARVLVRSFDEYLSDLICFLDRVGRCEPGKPVFVLAHSMGSTIVTLFAITHRTDVRGLILSGSLLKVPDNIPPVLPWCTFLASCIFPKLPVKKLESRLISRNLKTVERYDKDPLIYSGKILAGELIEINRAINRIQAGMETISLPLLILHGSDDYLVDVEGSKQLYACAQSADKTLKLYEGFYHAVLNEPGKNQVLSDIVAWLDTHL